MSGKKTDKKGKSENRYDISQIPIEKVIEALWKGSLIGPMFKVNKITIPFDANDSVLQEKIKEVRKLTEKVHFEYICGRGIHIDIVLKELPYIDLSEYNTFTEKDGKKILDKMAKEIKELTQEESTKKSEAASEKSKDAAPEKVEKKEKAEKTEKVEKEDKKKKEKEEKPEIARVKKDDPISKPAKSAKKELVLPIAIGL